MPHNNRAKTPVGPSRACPRCGGALEAALHLPERIGQPAYDIFRCAACGFVDWVAQDLARGPEPTARLR